MKILEIRDNGGKTIDRYTVVYDQVDHPGYYWCVAMNEEPFHPQGFGQHGSAMRGRHLGKRITFSQLPYDCQRLVLNDLESQPGGQDNETISR